MTEKIKVQKIFLNAMDSWFSNFIIEAFRTDHIPESKFQNEFMGTINDKKMGRLPMYFQPRIINFEFNTAYENLIFSNDIIIYNLNTGNIRELEYIINGLKSNNITQEKILLVISNIMTWSKTPDKIKTGNSNDEVIFIHPDDIKKETSKENNDKEDNNNNSEILKENIENNNNDNNGENISKENNSIKNDISKVLSTQTLSEKNLDEENKKIIVYYTEKDYLKRKPNSKYLQYKYIENEALLLNQKKNIKSYIICPGFIYGYGEKTFYSFFRNAILNLPVEEILLEKGRNIIPTIHMKDLINIISKIIEKKPNTYYILAFDQSNNNSLLNIAKQIYECVGDINYMMPIKEENADINNTNDNDNKDNKDNKDKDNNIEENNSKLNEDLNNNNNNTNNNNNNIENISEHETIEKKTEENTEKKKSFFSNNKYNISKDFPRDLLYLDIKLLPSEFIKGERKKKYFSNKESDEENNLSPKLPKEEIIEYIPLFKWHAPFGIQSNLQSIRKEFIKYRNLSINTILILGNPYSGKTELSKILSKIFHLPLIDIKMISDFGKSLAGINNNINNINNDEKKNYRKNSIEKDLIRDINKYMKELDENRAIAEENYNKRKDKKKTDPPFDDNMYYRFNDELLIRILNRRLQENDTSIYGYILDGFPKSAQQAEELMDDFEKNGNLPNSILIFENVEDDFLINRLKSGETFPKDPKDPQANVILERANRRLGKIKENKMQKEFVDLIDFFRNNEKYKNKIIFLDTKKTIIELIKQSQEFISKNNNNKINQTDEMLNCDKYIYDYIKEQELKKQKEEEAKKEELLKEENNKEILIEEKKEEKEENKDTTEKEENKDIIEKEEKKEIKTKEEIEKENMFKLLEKKSEILRRYLSENVLPLLSLGILQVATERPDDPVEAKIKK